MKHLYKLLTIICVGAATVSAHAQQNTNTNSPSDNSKATIEVQFKKDNSLQVKALNNGNKINQVILNFEDGSQEKINGLNKGTVNLKKGSNFDYAGNVIGAWVADDENITLLGDSTGYGEYIMNTTFIINDFHDVQSDRGNPNWSGNTRHCKPEYEPYRMGHKVLICKVPPGNPENAHEIWVACAAVEAHLRKGSTLGPCDEDDDFVIPVELVRFEGRMNGQVVELRWATASEINNHFFSIERSANGEAFQEIGQEMGNGNSSSLIPYGFDDRNPISGTAYYRLKQVDYDGTFEYSHIITVRNGGFDESAVKIFPNPCQNGDCQLAMPSSDSHEPVQINIYNVNGVLVESMELNGGADRHVNIGDFNLSSGMYIINIHTNNTVVNKKLMIK